jgi:fimbrial chaperone protein
MKHCAGIVTTALLLSQIAGASAARLLVEPILLEMNGAAAGTLTLRNEESVESDVQTRVFRWLQADGRETLEPTTDAVASPPAIRLTPHSDYTVRIVRTATEPVAGEESYRVIVDQLPSPGRQMQRAVNILIRQSIPVFFRAGQLTRANVSWSVTSEHGQISVSAVNGGDERLRIASLQLHDGAGTVVDFGNGLVGYVLGHSSMKFIFAKPPRGFGAVGPIQLAAFGNNGTIHATVPFDVHR